MTTERFDFGKNWQHFLASSFDEERLETAQKWMLEFLGLNSLKDRSFLDIGCGSGIHSLAALKSGCQDLYSFDYDLDSVTCTRRLRQLTGDPHFWQVQQGSVLDESFMRALPQYDIVYSWGVLHHTGDQWKAIAEAKERVRPGGLLYLALYTTEVFRGWRAPFWLAVKKLYNRSPKGIKGLLVGLYAALHCGAMLVKGTNPIRVIREYPRSRGMSYLTDIRDWLGGLPMEFSSINDVVQLLCREHGFVLTNLRFGEANTEYLFRREK